MHTDSVSGRVAAIASTTREPYGFPQVNFLGGLTSMFLRICVLIGVAVSVSACATEFHKPGASQAQLKSDSRQCWSRANKVKMTEEEKGQRVVVNTLIGGIAGGIGAAIANSEADKPYSGYHRGLHDECMRGRGYTLQ